MTLNGSLLLDEKLCLTRYSATNVVDRRYYEPLRVLGLTYLDSWHCSYQGMAAATLSSGRNLVGGRPSSLNMIKT